MANCTNCNKLKILGGVTREKLFFCSEKCFRSWNTIHNPNLENSNEVDSSIGRIVGSIFIGLGVLGIIGFFIALLRSGQMIIPIIPVIMIVGGVALYKKCNGKKK